MDDPKKPASAAPDATPAITASQPETTKRAAPRVAPIKVLATTRIAFPRQFDTLRAFVIANQSGQGVTLGEVSPHAGLSVNTLSMITSFFVTANLLTKAEGGKFSPTLPSVEFERQYHWDKETAPRALAPALLNTWFGQVIINRLKMRGSMSQKEAVELLASEAVATPDYEPQLTATLDWLIAAGVVDDDSGTIRISRKQIQAVQPKPPADRNGGDVSGKAVLQMHSEEGQLPPDDQAGTIKLNVAIQIRVKELEAMTPDRIAAFFQGLAAVVAAKGGKE